MPDGYADGVGAVGRSKLPADRRDVGLDGLVADVEARGDRLVRQPQGEKLQHFELAPCQRLLLDVGDVMIEFDGHPVGSPEDLLKLLAGDRVGRRVTLKVSRGEKIHEINVTVGERPE